MAIYFECPESKTKRVPEIIKKINEWTQSAALKKILDSFGASIPDGFSTADTVEWLLNFSDEWDYRKKQREAKDTKTNEAARWLLNDSELMPQQVESVMLLFTADFDNQAIFYIAHPDGCAINLHKIIGLFLLIIIPIIY